MDGLQISHKRMRDGTGAAENSGEISERANIGEHAASKGGTKEDKAEDVKIQQSGSQTDG